MFHVYNTDCLMFDQARKIFFELINGEQHHRSYAWSSKGDFGYFFEPSLNRYIAFDNRMNTMVVEDFENETDAIEFLFYDDAA